jgi:hypothetical protein
MAIGILRACYVSWLLPGLEWKFIKNLGPLHVSSITCSSSGGATQTTLGILRACCVSWLHQD